jgi:hypothetical protein
VRGNIRTNEPLYGAFPNERYTEKKHTHVFQAANLYLTRVDRSLNAYSKTDRIMYRMTFMSDCKRKIP